MRGNKIGNLTGNFQLYPCYYVLDHLNGVDRIVDESGEVVERYEYTAYGEATLFDNQSNEITESRVGNPYGFQGRRYDPESNLMYFRNRMYSPEMKRFISMDPLGFVDSMNLYETFGCDPVNRRDPVGLLSMNFSDLATELKYKVLKDIPTRSDPAYDIVAKNLMPPLEGYKDIILQLGLVTVKGSLKVGTIFLEGMGKAIFELSLIHI